MEIIITGQLDVSVALDIPDTKKELKGLCRTLGIPDNSSTIDIAKALVVQAAQSGIDDMDHRQSCEQFVEERDLEAEIQ